MYRFLLKRNIMSYYSGIHGLGSEIERYVYAFLTGKGESFSIENVVFNIAN